MKELELLLKKQIEMMNIAHHDDDEDSLNNTQNLSLNHTQRHLFEDSFRKIDMQSDRHPLKDSDPQNLEIHDKLGLYKLEADSKRRSRLNYLERHYPPSLNSSSQQRQEFNSQANFSSQSTLDRGFPMLFQPHNSDKAQRKREKSIEEEEEGKRG